MVEIPLKWSVGYTERKDRAPDEYVAASVPGAVQIDWAAAKKMPDWNRDTNFKDYRWMEDCYWVYTADIPRTDLNNGEQLIFYCGGVDYKYEVYLDEALIYAYEGMFRPFELDLGSAAPAGGRLSIVIYPIPKNPDGDPDTRQEANSCCKPAVSYGWDWHPRLVPSGIWDSTSLKIVPEYRIGGAEVLYTLSGDLRTARINVSADIKNGSGAPASGNDGNAVIATEPCACEMRFSLYAPDGSPVLETDDISGPIYLNDPELWWCNGYGEPNLYGWELRLVKDGNVLDKASGKTGFRKVSLEMNEGTWNEPVDFPKTRSRAPITLTINNVPVFAKGTNWVNPEIFPGIITADTYRPLLEYAKEANMNLLRVWGGGIVNKESFFDLCDSLGLMVWQEFPLACNKYPDTEKYLAVLESEASAIIKRLRGHASHVIWCGGNELYNNWSLMTDQSLPLRLLNKLCYEMDCGKPFLPTSPITGMAHGCYLFVYPDGREVYKAMSEARYTAYTEFGIPSVANLDTCLAATSRENLFPLERNEITLAHHAFDAWDYGESWCSIGTLREYFGEPDSLERLIEWSQWTQCEGYKCIYEEARRQKPYCSMSLNWCYNEPWPTIANNSLLNYPASPKPAYAAVAGSCRNRLVSARIRKFAWRPGEEFSIDLYILNDGQSPVPAGSAEAFLECGGEKRFLAKWDYPGAPANRNLAGPTVKYTLPECAPGVSRGQKFTELKLIISAGDMSSEYRLIIYP